jgi:hypothetical protein
MAETQKPSFDELFRRAAPLLAERQENQAKALQEDERTLLQDTTLAVFAELKAGRTMAEIEQRMTAAGWQVEKAAGFIRLVSQLLSKMYFQRFCIFAALTLFTGMLASVAVPMANAGDFPWLAALLSVGVVILSLLALLRNAQLSWKYRQAK